MSKSPSLHALPKFPPNPSKYSLYSIFKYGLSLYVDGINLVLFSIPALCGSTYVVFTKTWPFPPGLNDVYILGLHPSVRDVLSDPFNLSIFSCVNWLSSSTAMPSYSIPMNLSISFSVSNPPSIILDPLGNDKVLPLEYLYLTFPVNTLNIKSSNDSEAALPVCLRNKNLRPLYLWQSSKATCANTAWLFPGPLAPPHPISTGPLGVSASLAAAWNFICQVNGMY